MDTSKTRAALANLCRLRLQQLGGRATAREVAHDLGKPLKNILPRFSDLAAEGLIRDTGHRVRGGRGRPQVIWASVETTVPANDELACDETCAPDWFKKYGQ